MTYRGWMKKRREQTRQGVAPRRETVEGTGEEFSAGHGALSPMFVVSDDDARVLVRYYGSGEAAVTEKQAFGRRNVYSGVLQLPSSLLRRLAREAAGRTSTATKTTLSLPETAWWAARERRLSGYRRSAMLWMPSAA